MVDNIPSVQSGVLSEDAVVVTAISAGANLPLFAPVIRATKGTGEDLPRVNVTSTANDVVYGVTVNPLAAAGIVAVNIGDEIDVCIWGLCKCKVNGNSDNIAISEGLVTPASSGVAVKAAIDVGGTPDQASINAAIQSAMNIFAVAEEASAADGDFIPVHVMGSRGLIT